MALTFLEQSKREAAVINGIGAENTRIAQIWTIWIFIKPARTTSRLVIKGFLQHLTADGIVSHYLKNVRETPQRVRLSISVSAVVPETVSLTVMRHLGPLHLAVFEAWHRGAPPRRISMRSMATRCVFTHVAQHLLKVIATAECVPTQWLNINTCLAFKCTKGMTDVTADKSKTVVSL